MGGGSTTTQRTNQKQKTNMGPWGPTAGPLKDIVGAAGAIPGATNTTPTDVQTGAIGGLLGNAQTAIDQFNPQQTQLINDLYAGGNTGRGDQYLTQAGNALGNYLQPGYLDPNTNPYLQPSLNALQDQVKNSVSNQFALAGRDFSGDFSNALGKGYGNALAPLLMGQYNQNVSAQQNAASQMPGIASGLDASAINAMNARLGAPGQVAALNNPYLQQLSTAQTQAGLPYTNLNQAAQFLTPLARLGQQGQTNTTSTTTGTQASDPTQTAVGAGIGGVGLLGNLGAFGSTGWLTSALPFAAAASDRRLKEDIEQVGELYDGTPVYRFRYKGHPMTIIGLMADDVEKNTPEAVVTNADGYKFVDYKRATERALAK